jgi:hypothetical protein
MYVYLLLDGCAQLNLITTISKALEGLKLTNKHFYLNIKNLVEINIVSIFQLDYVPMLLT